MHSVSVNLHTSEAAPSADVLRLDTGERFPVLRFGQCVDIITPGKDLAAAAYLRQVATVCLDAANAIAAAIVEETSAPVNA